MSLRDFQAEVWADPKEPTAWPGKALIEGKASVVPRELPQRWSHSHRDFHHFCPAGNLSNNFPPGIQMEEHGGDCMLPTVGRYHLEECLSGAGRWAQCQIQPNLLSFVLYHSANGSCMRDLQYMFTYTAWILLSVDKNWKQFPRSQHKSCIPEGLQECTWKKAFSCCAITVGIYNKKCKCFTEKKLCKHKRQAYPKSLWNPVAKSDPSLSE